MRSSNQTAFFIALRYLFSPKKHNIIHIISIISVLGIMASTAALIIVLSVFNGFQDLVVSNFNRFNPPLKVEAREGKVFSNYELRTAAPLGASSAKLITNYELRVWRFMMFMGERYLNHLLRSYTLTILRSYRRVFIL